MSDQRTKFVQALNAGKWQDAFYNLNALSMEEMLRTLASVAKPKLEELIARRFAYKSGVGMPRMEYAWTVVKSKKLPRVAPGDLLTTGQVGTAAQYLKIPTARPLINLNLSVFTQSSVKNRTLFGELQQQASNILKSQGDGFKLDVKIQPTDLKLQEEVYLVSQIEDLYKMASKYTPVNRLMILMLSLRKNQEIYGGARRFNNQRYVILDTNEHNPDLATLLHEIGHCADLPHAGAGARPVDVGDAYNVMAEPIAGVARTQLTVTQGEYLSKAFFAQA